MGVETGGVRNPLIRLVSDERVFLRAVWVVAAILMFAAIWASTLSYENAAWVTLTGPLFVGAALYSPGGGRGSSRWESGSRRSGPRTRPRSSCSWRR